MQDYSSNFYQIPQELLGESADLQTIEEDLKTFAHNYWTRAIGPAHAVNNKRWQSVANLATGNIVGAIFQGILSHFNFTDKIDKKYFDSMYTIKQPLADKLRGWVKGIKDAFIVKSNSDGNLNKHALDTSGKNGTASKHVRLATRGLGQGMTTTATCFYKLNMGEGHAILYFTFDGKSIEDVKVLCLKQGADPKENNSYYVKEISEWKQVSPEEYKK